VHTGESLGSVRIRGGEAMAVAGADLVALVPTVETDRIHRILVTDPAAAFPPAPGERIGWVRVRTPTDVLGTVPVVAGTVPPPEPEDDPWWARAAGAVVDAVGGVLDALTG
jgi:hypothetical protein